MSQLNARSAIPAKRTICQQAEPVADDALAPDGDAKRERMLRQIAQHAASKLAIFRRVYFGRGPAPRLAIKAQCLHCAWMDIAAIQRCTDTACPLWRVRPYQDGGQSALCLTLPPAP